MDYSFLYFREKYMSYCEEQLAQMIEHRLRCKPLIQV